MSTEDHIVLAYSGGLDTSYCLHSLSKEGRDVHAVFVDTGGVTQKAVKTLEERALSLGAKSFRAVSVADDLWLEFVVPAVWAEARASGQYPLLCSDRYLIVKRCLEICDELGTRHFAHGCTGMGNDQFRFDQSVSSLGDYIIHAPIRDLQRPGFNVRDYELAQLEGAGVAVPVSNQRYSINENLLGVTISGSEIDKFAAPDESTHTLCAAHADWPDMPMERTLNFEKGVAIGLDGQRMAGPELLARLNADFGAYGVGRHIYTGDVTIGIKGRIVFECPGLAALYAAHRALEDATNTKWQNAFRHIVSARWAELVYTGFFFEPHLADLTAYLKSSQSAVTGSVTLKSAGGSLEPVAIQSDHILTDPDAVYAQSSGWSSEEVRGFIKLAGKSTNLRNMVERARK